MKKWISIVLAAAMILGLTGCGSSKAVEEPKESVYRQDVQEYITDIMDESATITLFDVQSSNVDGDTLEAVCVALYEGDAGENRGTFTLTYSLEGSEWVLEKCRVSLSESQVSSESEETSEATEEDTQETEESTEVSEETVPEQETLELSDNWKDFTFEMGGVVYQLPSHYQTFVANGWRIDEERSDVTLDYMVPGYSRCYVRLTNGAVDLYAELVNMSGNARVASDCDIGGITIEASDNLGLKLAGGIGSLSTLEEVQTAYGTPAGVNSYTDYASVKYQVSDYSTMSFYIYVTKTTYNEVTLRNYVPGDRDATTPVEERPAYLDEYVAPTELGSDIYSTVFELDGVLYQLPCPLDEFINNGWTVTSDSVGTLGAWNYSSGVTIKKGDYSVYLTLMNFSDYETYSKNCAVCAAQFSGYYFKNAPWGTVKLPGGVSNTSATWDVEGLYANFDRYDGTYATTFTYDNDEYTVQVKFSYYRDDAYCEINLKNRNWEY